MNVNWLPNIFIVLRVNMKSMNHCKYASAEKGKYAEDRALDSFLHCRVYRIKSIVHTLHIYIHILSL